MGVHPPAPDDVTAGRWKGHASESGQQGPGQKNRGANLGAQSRIEGLPRQSPGVYPERIGASPLSGGAEIEQERQQGPDISDARNIVQIDGTVGQHGGG